MVAEELRKGLTAKGHQVVVHHIDDAEPKDIPSTDLYVFGSPTRFGGPIGSMKRFLKKASLPPEAKYALFETHGDAVPNKKTGNLPTEEELVKERRTIPGMEEILKEKGLVKIADRIYLVRPETLKGPLKEGWQVSAAEFASAVLASMQALPHIGPIPSTGP